MFKKKNLLPQPFEGFYTFFLKLLLIKGLVLFCFIYIIIIYALFQQPYEAGFILSYYMNEKTKASRGSN